MRTEWKTEALSSISVSIEVNFAIFTLRAIGVFTTIPILANLVNRGDTMKTISATEAQNNFGDLLMNAQSEPISITRNGKEKGVLLSATAYQEIKLQALQQAITNGIESGDPSPLNMMDIKNKARERMGLDAKN